MLFVLALLAFVGLGLPDAVLGVAWPSLRRTFAEPLDALGIVLASMVAGYLVSSFLSGEVTRRVGVGRVLVASSVLVVASMALCAAAPAFVVVVAGAFLGGLGGGAIDAGINAFAADHFTARRIAWLHASWGLGASLGAGAMTLAISSGAGWRWGYGAVGVAVLLLALSFARTRRQWEVQAHDAERAATSLGASLRRPAVQAHVALFFVCTGLEASAGQWAFTLLTEGRGFSTALAGSAVSGYWLSFTTARVACGFAAARIPTAALVRSALVAAPLAAGALALAPHPMLSVLALALLGSAVGPVFPLLISLTPRYVGAAHVTNAVGFQVAAASTASAALPALIGVLARRLGLEAIGVALVIVALTGLVLHEAIRRRTPVRVSA